MGRMFFSADWHLGHANVIKFCNRPYKDVDEMDEAIISNCNSVVTPKDILHMIGDFSWKDPTNYLRRINCPVILIAGGHDYRWRNKFDSFRQVFDSRTIEVQGQTIVLSHFCYRVWNKSHYNSWHLYGHNHGKLEPIGKSWDVGIDANNWGPPLSLEQIYEIMSNRPDNPNYIPRERRSNFIKKGEKLVLVNPEMIGAEDVSLVQEVDPNRISNDNG